MYLPTIGLEIHAELLTESKLFCGCRNNPNEEEPNMHVCPVCVGYPGALPFLNRKAVEHMLCIGVALEGEVAVQTAFDRKHYFYPDIPKGYQISQSRYPLVRNATLGGISIQQVHLEEDTAKSSHEVTTLGSVIDFNRSGVPLMELVTNPVMHTAEEALHFAENLQMTLRYLGVARARMEWGEMRVEANISVSDSETLGTKVEVKNLNSFKAVAGAIAYEIERQGDLLKNGESVVQETRGWNENTEKTFSQRVKETSAEYRYMPEPDIPACRTDTVEGWDSEALQKRIPELPLQKIQRYIETLQLPVAQAKTLVKHKNLADIFDGVTTALSAQNAPRLTANYLVSDVMQYMETTHEALFTRVTVETMTELITLLVDGKISSRGAKDIIARLVSEGGSPVSIAETAGMFQESDTQVLDQVVSTVLQEQKSVVDEYRNGKVEVLQFLVGQVMKKTKGSANPVAVQDILKQRLHRTE